MTRPLVVIGTLVAFAAAFAAIGPSSQVTPTSPAPGRNAAAEPDGEGGPEAPALYMALKERSGKQLTTEMYRRAMRQADAMPVSTGTWQDLGPTNIGGRITDLVVDSSRPDTIFVAAAGGGVWKSTDAGRRS